MNNDNRHFFIGCIPAMSCLMAEFNSGGRTTMPIRFEPNSAAGDFRSPESCDSNDFKSVMSIGPQLSNGTCCMIDRLSRAFSSCRAFGGTFAFFKVMSSSLSNACMLGSRSKGGRNELTGVDELKATYWNRF